MNLSSLSLTTTNIQKAGQSKWLGWRKFSQAHIHPVNLLAHWKLGEIDPWVLATNLSDRIATLRFYKRRLKDHGFEFEITMLYSFKRLSRLSLAMVIFYVWLVSFGAVASKKNNFFYIKIRGR